VSWRSKGGRVRFGHSSRPPLPRKRRAEKPHQAVELLVAWQEYMENILRERDGRLTWDDAKAFGKAIDAMEETVAHYGDVRYEKGKNENIPLFPRETQ
jgi:hypothetical protein